MNDEELRKRLDVDRGLAAIMEAVLDWAVFVVGIIALHSVDWRFGLAALCLIAYLRKDFKKRK